VRRDGRGGSHEGLLAYPRGRATRGGGTQRPEGTAPAVLGPGLAPPLAVIAQVVPELPAEFLRLRQEVEIAAAEDDEFLRRRRLPAYHQQAVRDVIDAVAVRVQWHHAVGMLEQADVIA
jgi:hypothetical protein